jgi:hypothetical protein
MKNVPERLLVGHSLLLKALRPDTKQGTKLAITTSDGTRLVTIPPIRAVSKRGVSIPKRFSQDSSMAFRMEAGMVWKMESIRVMRMGMQMDGLSLMLMSTLGVYSVHSAKDVELDQLKNRNRSARNGPTGSSTIARATVWDTNEG